MSLLKAIRKLIQSPPKFQPIPEDWNYREFDHGDGSACAVSFSPHIDPFTIECRHQKESS